MHSLLVVAAFLTAAVGVAHSWLGEQYIIVRLLRRADLPALFGSDLFTRQTLRFAWHLTTISWWGFAAVLMVLSGALAGINVAQGLLLAVAFTFLASAALALGLTRGRHLSWVVFLAIAGICVAVAWRGGGRNPVADSPYRWGMTELASVERFLAQRRVAVAGASRSGKKFGNAVVRDLRARGYEVSLVHPQAGEIDGIVCHPSVADLPEGVAGLVLVVPPDQTLSLVREAVAAGVEHVWMQQGSESPEAVELCREHGINEVHGECILMFAQPSGVHRFHRWIWGLLGRLPR